MDTSLIVLAAVTLIGGGGLLWPRVNPDRPTAWRASKRAGAVALVGLGALYLARAARAGGPGYDVAFWAWLAAAAGVWLWSGSVGWLEERATRGWHLELGLKVRRVPLHPGWAVAAWMVLGTASGMLAAAALVDPLSRWAVAHGVAIEVLGRWLAGVMLVWVFGGAAAVGLAQAYRRWRAEQRE